MVTSTRKTAPRTTQSTARTTKAPVKTTRPVSKKAAPVRKAAAETPARTLAAPKVVKETRPKKPKLVRDSFTIPKAEYTVLDALKLRSAKLAHPVKKSELLRAGIKALSAMNDAALLAALQAVPSIKTGRPKKD